MKERTVAENASVELLPCPFCGERTLPQKRSLLLCHRRNLVHQYKIECHTCSVVMSKTLPISAHVGNDASPKEDQELNSRWNTRVPAKPEWKTIDSAPKDGRTIICANIEEEPFLGRWVNERWCMIGRPQGSCGPGIVDLKNNLPCDATHWMPLPKPPEKK